jgi:TolB-like protein
MRRALLALLLLGPAAPASPAWAQSMTDALGQVAAKIEQVQAIRNKNLAVAEFPLTTGAMSEIGVFLADHLDAALTGRASAAGFKIVNRAQLCQVIRENKLWVDDKFDEKLHEKLGKLSQADYLVAGRLTGLGRQLAMTVRLVDSETGQQVWAGSFTLPLDEGLRALLERRLIGDGCGGAQVALAAPEPVPGPARPQPSGPAPAGEPLRVSVWTDKQSYRIGDMIGFGLRVNRDAYVTLVNIGTSGDINIIYPNQFSPNHFVRGGQDVVIPPPNSNFTLTVRAPTGFDQIRAIATEEPISLHASSFAGGTGTTFRSLDRIQTRDLAVGIKSWREQVPPSKWAEQVIAVEVKR